VLLAAGALLLGWVGVALGRGEDEPGLVVAMRALTGEAAPGAVSAARLKDEAGRVREALRGASARVLALEAILNTLQEPVVAVDAGGVVSAVNAATERLLGVTGAGLRGRPVEEVFTHEELADLCRRAATGEAASAVVRVARADGQRVWAAAATPMEGPGGRRGGVV
jgi:PAS domain S-box-containing protein